MVGKSLNDKDNSQVPDLQILHNVRLSCNALRNLALKVIPLGTVNI